MKGMIMKTTAVAAMAVALTACAVLLAALDRSPVVAAKAAPPAVEGLAGAAAADPVPTPVVVSDADAFQAECSACHMAYPPVMLPARSWQAIAGDLAHHFGEDASLDAATTAKISAYLVAHAAETANQGQRILQSVPADQVPLRITEMAWWRRAHYELPASAFSRPQVMSKSNCLACHRGGGEAEDD